MRLGIFPFAVLALYPAALHPDEWEALLVRVRRRCLASPGRHRNPNLGRLRASSGGLQTQDTGPVGARVIVRIGQNYSRVVQCDVIGSDS